MAKPGAIACSVLLLTCSVQASNGTLVVSSVPSSISTLSVGKNRLEGTGVTLSQILQHLVSEPVRVPAVLAAERFDVSVAAAPDGSLVEAFRVVARQAGISIVMTEELLPTLVLRQGTRSGEPLPAYTSHVARKHFSCSRCGVTDLKQALEGSLKQKVIFESEDLTWSNVTLEWVDEASITAGLREKLGLQLSREQRPHPIWIISKLDD